MLLALSDRGNDMPVPITLPGLAPVSGSAPGGTPPLYVWAAANEIMLPNAMTMAPVMCLMSVSLGLGSVFQGYGFAEKLTNQDDPENARIESGNSLGSTRKVRSIVTR